MDKQKQPQESKARQKPVIPELFNQNLVMPDGEILDMVMPEGSEEEQAPPPPKNP